MDLCAYVCACVCVSVCVLALISGDAVPGLVGRDGSAGDASFGDGEEEEEGGTRQVFFDGLVCFFVATLVHLAAGSRLKCLELI